MGEGSPLLILHGFLGMSDNWKSMGMRYAEAGMAVHLIDQRNHGRSFHSPEFSYAHMVADLEAYCKTHGLGEVMVLGHSMGGKAAMLWATQQPQRIRKLLVADIAPRHYPMHHQAILEALLRLDFEVIKTRSAADEALAQHFEVPSFRQFLLKNLYWKTPDCLAWRPNLRVLQAQLEAIGEALPPTALFSGPSLFLKGALSDYILPADYQQIQQQFPNATLATIAAAGHWLHAENPKAFFEESISFLAKA